MHRLGDAEPEDVSTRLALDGRLPAIAGVSAPISALRWLRTTRQAGGGATGCACSATRAMLIERNLPQQPEIFQHFASAHDDRSERALRNGHAQPRLAADADVQVAQERAAASEHDPAVTDIGAQLRRRGFERHADRL